MPNIDGGWILPSVIDPPRKCVQIYIPDDPVHLDAFRGAILDLARWYNWQRDTDHTAIAVSTVWFDVVQQIYDALYLECDMFDVRQNASLPCKLEKTHNGTDWFEFADLQKCPPRLRVSGGQIEWWDGAAWVPVPGAGDERETGAYDPPWPIGTVPSGQSAECLSAENIIATYDSIMRKLKADLDIGVIATISAAGITGVLIAFMALPIIAPIALSLSAAAIVLGGIGVADLYSTTTIDKLRCNLYCHAAADGSFTSAAFAEFYDQLSTDFSGAKLAIIQYYFSMLGPVGLSRQGAANAIAAATCLCECAYVNITYDQGTGVGRANIGDTFTITPTNHGEYGGYSQFVAHFSQCCTVKWQSGDVIARGGGNDFYWHGGPCGSDTYYLQYGASNDVNAHIGEQHICDYMSSTGQQYSGPFTLTLISIP